MSTRGAVNTAGHPDIADEDRDALHILPLASVELETPALSRARLIKNAHLDTVVEMFVERSTGSGQLEISALPRAFSWTLDPPHPDLVLLRKLAGLESFDVYSLRILFRELGVPLASRAVLTLSESKERELARYMTRFTQPLIREVYGTDQVDAETFSDILHLFRTPDQKKVLERLHNLASKLDIEIAEIPKFLEDYGDTFLSLSYYRSCLDAVMPSIDDFLDSLREMRSNFQLRSDGQLMKTCSFMEETINAVLTTTSGRLENFEKSTNDLWASLSADSFRDVEALVRQYHTTIGGVLCALSVKMYAWARLFPRRSVGGPVRRAEFVMTDMRRGMDRIQRIEDASPMLSRIAS